jgi:hypothetical protein
MKTGVFLRSPEVPGFCPRWAGWRRCVMVMAISLRSISRLEDQHAMRGRVERPLFIGFCGPGAGRVVSSTSRQPGAVSGSQAAGGACVEDRKDRNPCGRLRRRCASRRRGSERPASCQSSGRGAPVAGIGRRPVDPAGLVVLAIGVVVAALAVADLVPARSIGVPCDSISVASRLRLRRRAGGADRGIVGRPLDPHVVGMVLGMAVAVVLAIGLVVLDARS